MASLWKLPTLISLLALLLFISWTVRDYIKESKKLKRKKCKTG